MLDLLIAANAKRVAKLPKAARAGLAGALVYLGAVSLVNLAPEKMDYVPVLSNVTPVVAQVSQAGVTRTEVISHAEFTRINQVGVQLEQTFAEIEQNIDDAVNETIAEIDSISVGTSVWVDPQYGQDEVYYTNTIVREGHLQMNHIEYSDGIGGILILDLDGTGQYTAIYDDGTTGSPDNITWVSFRDGTVVISDGDFSASFDNGKEFGFN